MENLTFLFKEIVDLPKETKWVQFKNTNSTPQEISEMIPNIANLTALAGMDHGYVVWGVESETRNVMGTKFKPYLAKKGNKKLISWLSRLFLSKYDFHFLELEIDHKPIVILEISALLNNDD